MSTISRDTNPKVEEFLVELLRKADFTKRMNKIRSLTEFVRLHSFRAIKRANPESSDRECEILFVEYVYGKELAEKLKKYLENK